MRGHRAWIAAWWETSISTRKSFKEEGGERRGSVGGGKRLSTSASAWCVARLAVAVAVADVVVPSTPTNLVVVLVRERAAARWARDRAAHHS